jgi:nitroreductase
MNNSNNAVSAEQISSFLKSRRSTRDFKATPVPDEVINELIAAGLTAPSWSNTRPFLVAVATGEKRDRLSAEFLKRWDAVKDAKNGSKWAKFKLVFTRYGLPTSNWFITKPYPPDLLPRSQRVGKELFGYIGVERGDTQARNKAWSRNYEFFGAPTELFIFTHKSLGKFAASDAGLFMQNFMLEAHARGLGTCAQGAVSTWEDAVRAEFDIPKQYQLLCGLAVGYPTDHKINTFQAERIQPSAIRIDN